MEANCNKLTERILHLTLEIIYLLTGEENQNIVAKKTSGDGQNPIMVPLSSLLIPGRNNDQKILEVTQKMIDLLMRESGNWRHFNVHIKEEVKEEEENSAMKERKCLEGHKDLYKDVMMDNQPPLTSPDGINKRKRTRKRPRPLYVRESTLEDLTIPHHDQVQEQMGLKIVVKQEEEINETLKKDEMTMTVTKRESLDVSKGGHNGWSTPEECLILSAHYNKDDSGMAQCSPVDFEKLFIRNPPQRIHPSEKRFWCSMCEKSFVNKSGLVQHLRIHAGVRPFSCAVCGKSFIEKSQLNRHHRVHTGEKPFSCPICGKCFNDKGNRDKHVRTHTGEKPFSCPDCGKCFAQKVTLGLHKSKHCTGDHCPNYGGVSETESLSIEQSYDKEEAV